MYKQNFSFHTHTKGFDGRNTVEEMVQSARAVGFEKLGISNHFIVHPHIKDSKMYVYALKGGYHNIYSADFDEAVEKFKRHYDEVDKISQQTGFKIYKGMEADFFAYDGWREGFEKAREILKPDYVIGAAHLISFQDKLYNTHDVKNASKEEQNMLLHKYYQNVRAAAQSGIFDFLAHLDLFKKTGLGRDSFWESEEHQTVEALAKAGAKTEINTSGFKLAYDEPYPSTRILKLLAEYKVPVVLSDDAHDAVRLGDRFDKAYQMAVNAGIQNFFTPIENTAVISFKRQNQNGL